MHHPEKTGDHPIGAGPALSSARGNTIVEYAICGVAVLLIAIVGIQIFGGKLNGWLLFLKQDMTKSIQLTAQAHVTQAEQAAQFQKQNASNSSPSPASKGTPITSPNDTVEVAGANGTTDAYANDILDKAKAALANGSLTQAEYDVIVKLANKGHEIAQIQGLLQGALNQSQGNFDAYNNTQITFNGKSYTPAELQGLLQSTTTDFGALKQQASTLSGVLYTPAVLQSISDSGNAIQNNSVLSQQVNGDATANSGSTAQQYQADTLGAISTDTNQQSANICTDGMHLDSGNHCVP